MKKTTKLRQLLAANTPIIAPASWDGLSAMIAEKTGYPATFVSGFCLNASLKGVPDLGTESRAEVVDRARQIVNAVDIPVIVDAGNGYGGPVGTYQTIQELENIGAAGCFIEDQTYPPACPGLRVPTVLSMNEFMPKLKAALDARRDKDFLIIARTDAGATLGLEEAIRRCRAFAEAGADMVICVAGMPQDPKERLKVIREIGVPMGPMPPFYETGITYDDYVEVGNLKIISGLETVLTVAKSLTEVLSDMKETGMPDDSKSLTMNEWMDLMDLKKWIGLEKKYAEQ